jgi:hypothetical protein
VTISEVNMKVWIQGDGRLTSKEVVEPVVLNAALVLANRPHPNQLRLLPTKSVDGIAVLLVPPSGCAGSCNGIPLGPGTHVIQHADRIDIDDLTFWVAASNAVEIVAYDPDVHGADVFCLLTKARLQPGADIVCCPGCGMIYRSAAWEMVLDADSKFRCPGCRFDPFAGEWEPTLPRTSSLDRIIELARGWTSGPHAPADPRKELSND